MIIIACGLTGRSRRNFYSLSSIKDIKIALNVIDSSSGASRTPSL